MRILALDLGTFTGYALSGVSERYCSGVWDLRPGRFSGAGMRYLRLRQLLDQTVTSAGGIDALYFEEVRRHLGTDAAHVYGGCLAVVTAYCEEHSIPYQGVPVQHIKKRATTRGNANKQAMLEAARAKWPDEKIDSDDQADALWLLDLAMSG